MYIFIYGPLEIKESNCTWQPWSIRLDQFRKHGGRSPLTALTLDRQRDQETVHRQQWEEARLSTGSGTLLHLVFRTAIHQRQNILLFKSLVFYLHSAALLSSHCAQAVPATLAVLREPFKASTPLLPVLDCPCPALLRNKDVGRGNSLVAWEDAQTAAFFHPRQVLLSFLHVGIDLVHPLLNPVQLFCRSPIALVSLKIRTTALKNVYYPSPKY